MNRGAAPELALEQTEPDTSGDVARPTHRVTATQLNLRTTPRVVPSTRIASLPQDQEVFVLSEAEKAGWVRVLVELHGVWREGVVASRYLAPLQSAERTRAEATASRAAEEVAFPAVHLREQRRDVTRAAASHHAFPLGESGKPSRRASTPATRARQVLDIVRYLDSENPRHLRYQKVGASTYCNIYAYDFCYLCGVYLPRVWWTGAALARIARGEPVQPSYGSTVRELNANAIHDWFDEHGTSHGWHHEVDMTALQDSANAGEVCIIIAKRKDLNRSGHVTAVVPEHEAFHARRNRSNEVIRPVESQAGARNFRFAVNESAWWLSGIYQSFALWRHA
jgi:hypothetical protein